MKKGLDRMSVKGLVAVVANCKAEKKICNGVSTGNDKLLASALKALANKNGDYSKEMNE